MISLLILLFMLQYKDDAFLVIDMGDVLKKHETWLRELPSVTPFYSKSNIFGQFFTLEFPKEYVLFCNGYRRVGNCVSPSVS